MNCRTLIAGLIAAAAATPAAAAPFMAIDGNANILVMIDRGSIARYGGVREAETLYIIKGNQPVVFKVRYNCDMQTFEEIEQRVVNKTLTLGAPIAGSPGTKTSASGSLGAAVMVNVCQDKLVNTSGGWTRPDLKSAIEAGIAAGYVPAWP